VKELDPQELIEKEEIEKVKNDYCLNYSNSINSKPKNACLSGKHEISNYVFFTQTSKSLFLKELLISSGIHLQIK